MSKTFTEVSEDALRLHATDQLKLARLLLTSSDAGGATAQLSADSSDEWDREIARRLEELRSGVATGVPLEEVRRKLEARFKK